MNPLKYWSVEDFEIASYKFSLKEKINKIYNGCGSDNSGKCTYSYNELGYRGDSVYKEGFRIMSIGCSNTEGVGLNDSETWSNQFSNLVVNGVDLNFGISGRSSDYVSRCLTTYYDIIKPDLVLIMYPHIQRREFYTDDGGIEPFMPTSSWGYFGEVYKGKAIQEYMVRIQNTNQDIINWYKNHLLIKYFLESKKCNWIWNGVEGVPLTYNEPNRFDGNYNEYIDLAADRRHPGPLHNQNYAKDLHNFVLNNFPNYLNK